MLQIRHTGKGHSLFANEKPVPATVDGRRGDSYGVSLQNAESQELVTPFRLADVPSNIYRLTLLRDDQAWKIRVQILREDQGWTIRVRVNPNPLLWAQPWSVNDFIRRLRADNVDAAVRVGTGRKVLYTITRRVSSDEQTIGEAFGSVIAEHRRIRSRTEVRLAEIITSSSVTAQFSFPPDVRTACEQYLLHFVDFLREFGVEVDAELREEANRVLFAVTPTDHREALERIRAALSIYLQLPAAELVGMSQNQREQLAVQRLQMNIFHLKSQLAAAETQSLMLAATVEAQRYTITALKALATADLADVHDDTADREDILNGLVTLTPYKGEGFEVDVPELYRRLRHLFRRR